MNETNSDRSGGGRPPVDLTPRSITRQGEAAIRIQWSDETETHWTAAELRARCPCATCREKRRAESRETPAEKPAMLPVLSAAEAQPLRIEAMRPVGNYAYNIVFSDGHDSGIFPFPSLHESAK